MRQLLIGDGTTSNLSGGLEASGAIGVQKRDSNGEVADVAAGDTITDAKEIRIVQGTAAENIVSPWISGTNVVVWDGKSYTAPAASTSTITCADGNASSSGVLTLKFIRKDTQPQEFFNMDIAIASGAIQNDQPGTMKTAFDDATVPDWLNPTSTDGGAAIITFTGSIDGDTVESGATWNEGTVVFDYSQDKIFINGIKHDIDEGLDKISNSLNANNQDI